MYFIYNIIEWKSLYFINIICDKQRPASLWHSSSLKNSMSPNSYIIINYYINFYYNNTDNWQPGQHSQHSDSLQARGSRGWITVGARFSMPIQTSPQAHSPSCTMGTFPEVKWLTIGLVLMYGLKIFRWPLCSRRLQYTVLWYYTMHSNRWLQRGSRFLWNTGTIYQTTWHHTIMFHCTILPRQNNSNKYITSAADLSSLYTEKPVSYK